MTREDLKKYRYAQEWINRQISRYEEQRTIATNISQKIDGLPKAKNKSNYALEELIDQYDIILQMLNDDQKQQNEIFKQIRLVEEPYRTILTEKYIEGKSLEEIAVDIHYSYDRTCKMHGLALNLFDELEKNKSGQ